MPQVTYKFDLPEEVEELDDFSKGPSYRKAFREVWFRVRDKCKYGGDSLSEDELKAYNQVRDWICGSCSDEGVEVPW